MTQTAEKTAASASAETAVQTAAVQPVQPDMCDMVLRSHAFDAQALQNMEACAETGRALMMQGVKKMRTPIAFAYAVSDMRQMLVSSPKMVEFMTAAQNDPMFFKTDSQGGYPPAVVAACLTKACMMGIPWMGNCFNIIQGNFYLTKEGVCALLDQLGVVYYCQCDGIEEGRTIRLGTDRNGRQMADVHTVNVTMTAHYKTAGGSDRTETGTWEIRMNANTTTDNVIGKGEARILKRILAIVGKERQIGITFDTTDDVVQAEIPRQNLIDAAKASKMKQLQRPAGAGERISDRVAAALEAHGMPCGADELLHWLSMRGTPVASMADCDELLKALDGTVEAFLNEKANMVA